MMLNDISFKLVSEDELITGKKTYSIFVVDVDPLAVKVMSVLLKDAGHKITSMMESKSAFETILTMKPDCVICGLMMPSVDGFQLCKMIAEQPELNNTKFIMVSENAYEFDHKHSFTFGAHGYIRK